jgi:predicted HTH transcriptional regulator
LNKVNKDLMHSILKTIAGFSNSDGGTLLIGISDDKLVLGLDKDYDTLKRKDKDGFIQYLTQMILNNLGINIMRNISINIKTVSGKDVCQIEVLPANEPIFLTYNGKDEFFIRTANMTIPLTIKESYVYLQRRN